MNYCPECGHIVRFDDKVEDVATVHYYYTCHGSDQHKWEVTMDSSGDLLNIAPVKEKEDST